ncbi:type IV secretory system conjugative DNA transfer family protein [Pokkaliibacter plantistimulans]|uniref:type IV secretory system conjugative DNA transfer family protein n=1 Tax=Pokkaliibacter plantistimulans TaxID=1635171 RepID=UPI000D74B093|nr:TraM recognition domain-containing protein [Pokkaliibacter plantistimulans]
MEFLKKVILYSDPYIAFALALSIGIWLQMLVTANVVSNHKTDTTGFAHVRLFLNRASLILLTVVAPISFLALFTYAWIETRDVNFANDYIRLLWTAIYTPLLEMWPSAIFVAILPLFIRLFIRRWIVPAFSAWKRKFRIKQAGDALSDIRVDLDSLKPKDFTPQSYYKAGVIFLGLDGGNNPIYVDDDVFTKNHIKFIGPSQVGKGVGLGVILDQAIRKGWGVWFMDIKPDDFIYDIMRESCLAAGREEMTILDLNGVGPGSYAPFVHGTERDRRERVVKAFSLADTGTTADFYKRNERQCLDYIMPVWDGTLKALERIIEKGQADLPQDRKDFIFDNIGSISSNLSEFMQIPNVRGNNDAYLNIKNELDRGSVVYIRSAMKDTVVRKLSMALLEEVIQTVLKKPLPRHTLFFIDEVRFVTSESLADALATLLSKRMSMGLAYQSVLDLENLPDKSANAKSIKSSIETNTQITVSYRANDNDTAENISSLTGTIQKTVTRMEKVIVNHAGAEEWEGERSVGQQEEALITENQLKSLPPRIAALIRPNELATLLYTCWVPIKERQGMPERRFELGVEDDQVEFQPEPEAAQEAGKGVKNKEAGNKKRYDKKARELSSEERDLVADALSKIMSSTQQDK